MFEVILVTFLAILVFYIAEKDNKSGELYKLLH
jgi:hypothetical protein